MIWTIWIDYFATGEGRTIFLNVVTAWSREEALKSMERNIGTYSDYFMMGVEIKEGFDPKNRYVLQLLSNSQIDQIVKGGGMINVYVQSHFNYA